MTLAAGPPPSRPLIDLMPQVNGLLLLMDLMPQVNGQLLLLLLLDLIPQVNGLSSSFSSSS